MLTTPTAAIAKGSINHLLLVGYQNISSLPLIGADEFIHNLTLHFFPGQNIALKDLMHVPLAKTALVINAKCIDPNRPDNLLQQLKTIGELNGLPVIVISDRMHLTDANKFILAGADDFYDAPVLWEELWNRLAFLGKYKKAFITKSQALETIYFQEVKVSVPIWKRIIDIVLGTVGIIGTLPIMLLTACAIRLESKGPVLYCSTRIGAGCREFKFWKFRSMYSNADQILEQLVQNNQYGADATFKKFVNDPRITKVGRFIRKYSIDELPQLFNIIKGDMSVVGNRPLPVYEANQLVNYQAVGRFLAPAGLTGLWQVNKRGQNNMSQNERIALDLQYADNNSIVTDLQIIARTFTAFVQKENV